MAKKIEGLNGEQTATESVSGSQSLESGHNCVRDSLAHLDIVKQGALDIENDLRFARSGETAAGRADRPILLR